MRPEGIGDRPQFHWRVDTFLHRRQFRRSAQQSEGHELTRHEGTAYLRQRADYLILEHRAADAVRAINLQNAGTTPENFVTSLSTLPDPQEGIVEKGLKRKFAPFLENIYKNILPATITKFIEAHPKSSQQFLKRQLAEMSRKIVSTGKVEKWKERFEIQQTQFVSTAIEHIVPPVGAAAQMIINPENALIAFAEGKPLKGFSFLALIPGSVFIAPLIPGIGGFFNSYYWQIALHNPLDAVKEEISLNILLAHKDKLGSPFKVILEEHITKQMKKNNYSSKDKYSQELEEQRNNQITHIAKSAFEILKDSTQLEGNYAEYSIPSFRERLHALIHFERIDKKHTRKERTEALKRRKVLKKNVTRNIYLYEKSQEKVKLLNRYIPLVKNSPEVV